MAIPDVLRSAVWMSSDMYFNDRHEECIWLPAVSCLQVRLMVQGLLGPDR